MLHQVQDTIKMEDHMAGYPFNDYDGSDESFEKLTEQAPARTPRPLWKIAQEIRAIWTRPYFGAVPYIDAMYALDKITDDYGADSAESIVLYFLANAGTWRGEDARRIKAELRKMTTAGR